MPIIKSAKKKMRKDKVRTKHNEEIRNKLKGLVKNARRTPNPKVLQELHSALDKAVKIKLIHANKAARLKSRLSKGSTAGSQVSGKSGPGKKAQAKKRPARSAKSKK